MNAGPRNGQIFGTPRERPSSEARAARATAASPGRTSSTVPSPFAGSVDPEDVPGTGSTRATSSSPILRSGLFMLRLPANPHAAGELRPEGVSPAGDLDHQRSSERLPSGELEPIAGLDLALGEVPEHRRVAVGDASEGPPLAGFEIGQRHRVLG